jgi:hypothetical protein
MIILALIQLIVATLSILLSVLPQVTQLPWGLDSLLVSGAGYIHYMMTILPPLAILFNAFMAFMVFKLVMLVVRLIPWFGRIF